MGLFACQFFAGCQNDYPLEPTPCDYWCAAFERPPCGHIDPAECVALCEKEFIPACLSEFTEAHECMVQVPDAVVCSPEGYLPSKGYVCDVQMIMYRSCRARRESPYE